MSSLNQWNSVVIKQHKKDTGQALFSDEQTLAFFSQDFGKLIHSPPSAVCLPQQLSSLQSLIAFAHQHSLPITIRGNGLSQGGQALPLPGGLTLSMRNFNKPLDLEENTIWVEANTTWSDLLNVSLQQHKAPFVLPYNCNLSVAGVLSAGGVGSSSFKYGAINAHVAALEVIDGLGNKHIVKNDSPLFHACLSGQGRFAVITKACIQLRPVQTQVATFFLVYSSQDQWFEDIEKVKSRADYMELFCSPSVQGAKLKEGKRVPIAQWLYGLHFSVEHEQIAPALNDVIKGLKPWQIIHSQEEDILSYFLRHNSRFDVMKMLGQWDLFHPWYECFITATVLKKYLNDLLHQLPIHYANIVHVVPMARESGGFLMFPEGESVYSFMILNPGIPGFLKESCMQAIQTLDECFISSGGKRYLSGFLGQKLSANYWINHFGEQYNSWINLKKEFDPKGIFSSMLHQS
ncbi:FAD-binding oxidoreductase [Legionella fallonii]|uniref:Cytochrome C oxidase subunit III n=1 Tax=Legionella fallonii LLAP-10 TaxID=1212491 RepID=A0A098G1P0_9GAMM|nr:FAD-binding oxidoreductase [Legionella fallonii]CEG56403.1 Cytochrome C oxidase subunit III [Legionella fallonii LLAP-10]